ncbi:MAG: hypothetical protein V1495_09150 [Pseudomonadota bacterium]
MKAPPIFQPHDTDPETNRILFDLYRKMTPQQKAEKIVALWHTAQSLGEAGIRSRHPGISERELKLRVASRRIPRELMIEAFGWDPRKNGY